MNLKEEFKKPFFFFAVIASTYAFFRFLHAILKIIFWGNNLCDFKNYYAASRLLSEGGNIYQLNIGYHPLFFYLFNPLRFFSLKAAALLWVSFLIFLLFLSIKLTVDLLKRYGEESFGIILFFIFGFITFSFSPLLEDFAVGQINVILLLLFTILLNAYAKNELACALALSLMVLSKLQFGIFFLFFLWKKQYKIVLGAVLLYGLWTLVAWILGGDKLVSGYYDKIFFFLGPQDRYEILAREAPFHPCIFIALAKIFFNSGLLSMAVIKKMHLFISLGLVFFTVFKFISREVFSGIRGIYELTLAALLMLFINPFTEEHHLIILIPVFCIMFFTVSKNGVLTDFILYAVSFLLIGLSYSLSSFPFFNSGFLSIFIMGKFFGMICLYFLLTRSATPQNGVSQCQD